MRLIFWIMIFSSLLLHASFSRNSSGIVVDSITGLAWQDDYSDNGDSIKEANWQDAIIYCEELNLDKKSDWRLPNKNELFSIVDMSKFKPCISSIFINVIFNSFWSSTSYASDSSTAWIVSFIDSFVGLGGNKKHHYSVRCVRGGL